MPLFPYRILNPVHPHLSEETVRVLEHWVNYGLGPEADFVLDTFWYELLSGRYLQAARLGSTEQLRDMGWVLSELVENAPADCFGSEEKVRAWRGLVAEDRTILSNP